ncbi:3-dehydroquinate synthase [Candidatus Desantisbacteria bacterium]|nr:3-dehydroquinate synthase [Candidatus Desantisbacteria bacterium]
MKIIKVNLKERSYPIYIDYDIIDKIGLYARKKVSTQDKIVIITNPLIGGFYLEKCRIGFEKYGFKTYTIMVPDGEKYKNLDEAVKIYSKLLKIKADRNTTLVALGGGVIGDITGYVAATYLRGIPFIQVPTTLLAQVDSSVGGKVAVNLIEGKNLIGAFYQPILVYIDCNVLNTLAKREICAGMAEVIKYGIIKDRAFFNFIEKNIEKIINLEKKYIEKVVAVSCKIKALVVKNDEKEKGERAILNFGHTIGHALEAETQYKKYIHGEAVAIGMVGAMKLAGGKFFIKKNDTERVVNLLIKAGLPIKINERISISGLLENMKIDKKVSRDIIRFVLTKKIGYVTLNPINDKGLLISVLSELFN